MADVPEERRNDAYAVIDPDGVGPRVFFLKVPQPPADHPQRRVAPASIPGLSC